MEYSSALLRPLPSFCHPIPTSVSCNILYNIGNRQVVVKHWIRMAYHDLFGIKKCGQDALKHPDHTLYPLCFYLYSAQLLMSISLSFSVQNALMNALASLLLVTSGTLRSMDARRIL